MDEAYIKQLEDRLFMLEVKQNNSLQLQQNKELSIKELKELLKRKKNGASKRFTQKQKTSKK